MSNAEDVPTPKDFNKWSVKIAGYWFELGTELGVPGDHLTNININTQLYPTHERRAFQMLKTWKELGGASYRTMADALRGLDKVELANSICLPMEDDSHIGARMETRQTLTPGSEEKIQQKDVPFVKTADFHVVEDAVCQIKTRKGELGSGFYAKVKVDGLAVRQGIFTANHVIPSPIEAEHAKFNFGYEDKVNKRGHKIQLKPRIFRTSHKKDLDYSFIGVDVDQLPDVKPLKFKKETGVKRGDKGIHIIQYPDGRPKEFSHGEITEVNRHFVHYNVNTEGGSSGSPVLKNMKVIAIHHHGVKGSSNWGTLCSAVINHLTTGEHSRPPNPINTGAKRTRKRKARQEPECPESGPPNPTNTDAKRTRKRKVRQEPEDTETNSKESTDAATSLTNEELEDLSEEICSYWFRLGTSLGVSNERLVGIRSNNVECPSPEEKALQMLTKWKENGGTRAQLVAALEKKGKGLLAKKYMRS